MRGEIGQGARVEIAGRVEAPHGVAVTQPDAIELGVLVLDVDRMALVGALGQAIHERDRVALGPSVGQGGGYKNNSHTTPAQLPRSELRRAASQPRPMPTEPAIAA